MLKICYFYLFFFFVYSGCPVDIVFVVDSSRSIREHNPPDGSFDFWNSTLGFVAKIIETMTVENGARVSIFPPFYLTYFQRIEYIVVAVRGLTV